MKRIVGVTLLLLLFFSGPWQPATGGGFTTYHGVPWGATEGVLLAKFPDTLCRPTAGVLSEKADRGCYRRSTVRETLVDESFWFRAGGLVEVRVKLPADAFSRILAAYEGEYGPWIERPCERYSSQRLFR